MFWKRKEKLGSGIKRQGDTSVMKIKNGWNEIEQKYYIQITDKKTLESFRIYLEAEYFHNFASHMLRTEGFTQK